MLKNQMHKSSFRDLRLNSCVKTSPAMGTGLDPPALLTLVWMFIHSFFRPPVACLSWPSLSSPRLPTPCHLAPLWFHSHSPSSEQKPHRKPRFCKRSQVLGPCFCTLVFLQERRRQKEFLERILKVHYQQSTTFFIVK